MGPAITSSDAIAFAKQHRIVLPDGYVWLVSNVVNGGRPTKDAVFDVAELHHGEESCIQGIYGINHPTPLLDLCKALALPINMRNLAKAFPFAFDPGDNFLVVMVSGDLAGQVRFSPWEEYSNPDRPANFYPVAANMQEFVRAIRWLP